MDLKVEIKNEMKKALAMWPVMWKTLGVWKNKLKNVSI